MCLCVGIYPYLLWQQTVCRRDQPSLTDHTGPTEMTDPPGLHADHPRPAVGDRLHAPHYPGPDTGRNSRDTALLWSHRGGGGWSCCWKRYHKCIICPQNIFTVVHMILGSTQRGLDFIVYLQTIQCMYWSFASPYCSSFSSNLGGISKYMYFGMISF